MKLLRIDTSVRVRGSASRELGDAAEHALASRCGGLVVRRRDLGTDPLPAVWQDALGARSTPEATGYLGPGDTDPTGARSAGRRIGEEMATELLDADAVLLTVPMYNFGAPYQLKQWVDLVITDPRASDTSVPILAGRPALVVVAKGGAYGPGSPREGHDHAGPWLRTVLASTWGLDLTLVDLELTMAAANPRMRELVPVADRLRSDGRHRVERWAELVADAR